MIKTFIIITFLGFFLSNSAYSCDIEFSVIKNKKEIYEAGDKVIVKVSVLLTHRNCLEGIEKTDFKTKGLEISKATKWVEVLTGLFERKLMITINGSKDGKGILSALRTCEKEGGYASLSFKIKK